MFTSQAIILTDSDSDPVLETYFPNCYHVSYLVKYFSLSLLTQSKLFGLEEQISRPRCSGSGFILPAGRRRPIKVSTIHLDRVLKKENIQAFLVCWKTAEKLIINNEIIMHMKHEFVKMTAGHTQEHCALITDSTFLWWRREKAIQAC